MNIDKHIFLIGMPGCGKTSFGEALAEKLGLKLYDTDDHLETMREKTIPEIFEQEGEDAFRDYETESLRDIITKEPSIVATGGGIVKYQRNRDLLSNGIVIFINRSVDHILSDLDSEARPLLAENKNKIYNLYDERYDLYRESADYVVANDKDFDQVVEDIIEIIEKEMERD